MKNKYDSEQSEKIAQILENQYYMMKDIKSISNPDKKTPPPDDRKQVVQDDFEYYLEKEPSSDNWLESLSVSELFSFYSTYHKWALQNNNIRKVPVLLFTPGNLKKNMN
eukprot:TRINITY_DN3273_c0_g1_i1.p1 TRINITY_DN3273_c0_g1~~TRINITY_DN3273_c0_g1_i1.p1  ORF type:complete len:109 (+),score=21.90 TRINITY_DN3273_c0_g1_i1:222-548(+)